MMSWILCDHLKPELFEPYRALWITSICHCSSSNSGPATMYSFSLVVASRYALPMSAPKLSCCSIWLAILIGLGILLSLLQNRCYLFGQELGDHLLLTFHRKINTEIITFSAHNYNKKTNQTTLSVIFQLNIFFLH